MHHSRLPVDMDLLCHPWAGTGSGVQSVLGFCLGIWQGVQSYLGFGFWLPGIGLGLLLLPQLGGLLWHASPFSPVCFGTCFG